MILNIHPSLLPRYRGANPYMAVLQAGESETGITVHQVTTGIDSGPILAQERVFIDSYDTGGSLQRRCAEAMHRLLPRILNQLAQVYPAWEKLPWHAQNEAFKSTCKALSLGMARLTGKTRLNRSETVFGPFSPGYRLHFCQKLGRPPAVSLYASKNYDRARYQKRNPVTRSNFMFSRRSGSYCPRLCP